MAQIRAAYVYPIHSLYGAIENDPMTSMERKKECVFFKNTKISAIESIVKRFTESSPEQRDEKWMHAKIRYEGVRRLLGRCEAPHMGKTSILDKKG